MPRSENSCQLLRHFTLAAQYPSVSSNVSISHYLAADLRHLTDISSRRRLRSSLTVQLNVCQSQCLTVGDHAFAVAGARLWNSMPHDIIASDTLLRFSRALKTFYLDSHILLFCSVSFFVVLAVFN